MKLNRSQLRRLIESTLKEADENETRSRRYLAATEHHDVTESDESFPFPADIMTEEEAICFLFSNKEFDDKFQPWLRKQKAAGFRYFDSVKRNNRWVIVGYDDVPFHPFGTPRPGEDCDPAFWHGAGRNARPVQ